MKKGLIILLKSVSILFIILLTWTFIQYIICPIYHYPASEPFTGSAWFNPYQDMQGKWLKANFQVQSNAWLGLTDGNDKTDQVYDFYKNKGYDIITISDYQHINRFDNLNVDTIPVYEHGYNATKAHHVIIGADRVVWRDYLLWQNRDNKQHLLTLLRKTGQFVVIAHPRLMHAFSAADMQNLVEYDAIEVLNHYRNSSNLWDIALSSGKPVWIISDDDSHDISDPDQTGVCWTMIHANSPHRNDVIPALKKGNMYGVTGKNAENHTLLKDVSIEKDILRVKFTGICNEIRFIGQDGVLQFNKFDTSEAQMNLSAKDTYIRIEADCKENTLYLNPVFRYNGERIIAKKANVDEALTALQYCIWCILLLGGSIYRYLAFYPKRKPEFAKIKAEVS